MHMTSKLPRLRASLLATLLGLPLSAGLGMTPGAVAAQDAPHPAAAAPSSGSFRGFSGTRWASDFGVRSGHCDRQRIATSPQRGDAIASLGQRRALNRHAAMLIGAGVPDLLPTAFGAELDEGDRACMGQVLELAASGLWVSWDNSATGIHYEMRPDAGRDGIAGACRAFRLKAAGNYQHVKRDAMACETGPGLWQLSGL